jgi:hypothetical protein
LPRTAAPFCPLYIHTYKYNHIYSPRLQRPWEGWTPTGAGGVRGRAGAAQPQAQGPPPDPRFPTLPGGLRLPCFGGGGTRRGRAQRGGEQDHTLIDIYTYIRPCYPPCTVFFGPFSCIMDMWRSHRTRGTSNDLWWERPREEKRTLAVQSYSSSCSIKYKKIITSKYIQ